MYFGDHPPPHFHAFYGGSKAVVDIETLALIEGRLPPRARGLVIEWATIHQDELERLSAKQRLWKLRDKFALSIDQARSTGFNRNHSNP